MKTAEQIKADNPIRQYLENRGVRVPAGTQVIVQCPFHDDRTPSMSVNTKDGTWHCFSCDIGGSVIDLEMKYQGVNAGDAMVNLAGPDEAEALAQVASQTPPPPIDGPRVQPDNPFTPPPKVVAEWIYRNEVGEEAFRVRRLEPKSFRQGHFRAGAWIPNMDGVRRVPFNLPEVLKAERVYVAEGEVDCDALHQIDCVATCNPGGAGKWLDSYSPYFEGKEVVICPDSDEPGRKHAEQIRESIAPYAAWMKQLRIPSPHKDIREYLEAGGEIEELIDDAPKLYKGLHIPIVKLTDVEDEYIKSIELGDKYGLDLGKWLPSLRKYRKLVPGEVLLVMGYTGSGKTSVGQQIARIAKPMKVLFFELELPINLMYERQVGIERDITGDKVEYNYKIDMKLGLRDADHIYVCPQPKMNLELVEQIINNSELVIGEKPNLVILDYAQLMQGTGSRYERMSDVADGLKIIARFTKTIVVIISQPGRPTKDKTPQLCLYSSKDSGNFENSSGMVIGLERDIEDDSRATVKVFKATKGKPGLTIDCNFNNSLKITEVAKHTGETHENR